MIRSRYVEPRQAADREHHFARRFATVIADLANAENKAIVRILCVMCALRLRSGNRRLDVLGFQAIYRFASSSSPLVDMQRALSVTRIRRRPRPLRSEIAYECIRNRRYSDFLERPIPFSGKSSTALPCRIRFPAFSDWSRMLNPSLS